MADTTHPSHDWWEIDEGTRVARFCNKCDICACHSNGLASEECPGEIVEPDPPAPDLNEGTP